MVAGERVEIDKQGLASKVILEKTVGGWTRVVSSAQTLGCPCPRERSFTTFVFRFCRGRISTGHSFARAAGKDRLRGIRSRQELAPAHAAVNTIQAATLTLLVFAIAGMLPAVAITRWSGATPAWRFSLVLVNAP